MGLQGRLAMIFSQDEMRRVSIKADDIISPRVIVDVHGMSCREAKRFINNIINVSRMEYQLTVIHGYNRGTAIKGMLNHEFENRHVYYKVSDSYNSGRTHLSIA